jgi:hypothetical protein
MLYHISASSTMEDIDVHLSMDHGITGITPTLADSNRSTRTELLHTIIHTRIVRYNITVPFDVVVVICQSDGRRCRTGR